MIIRAFRKIETIIETHIAIVSLLLTNVMSTIGLVSFMEMTIGLSTEVSFAELKGLGVEVEEEVELETVVVDEDEDEDGVVVVVDVDGDGDKDVDVDGLADSSTTLGLILSSSFSGFSLSNLTSTGTLSLSVALSVLLTSPSGFTLVKFLSSAILEKTLIVSSIEPLAGAEALNN